MLGFSQRYYSFIYGIFYCILFYLLSCVVKNLCIFSDVKEFCKRRKKLAILYHNITKLIKYKSYKINTQSPLLSKHISSVLSTNNQ